MSLRKSWATKKDWPSIGARVSPETKAALKKKHPNEGEVSQLINALVSRYLEGKIYGLKICQE